MRRPSSAGCPEGGAPVTAAEVRAAARALRLRIESGERLTLEEARAACVTMQDALLAFDRTEDAGDETRVFCCGEPAQVVGGLFGVKVGCPRCGAKAVEATSPMYSPFLERGNSYITTPSKQWVEAFGVRTWLVMHEGDRPLQLPAKESRP